MPSPALQMPLPLSSAVSLPRKTLDSSLSLALSLFAGGGEMALSVAKCPSSSAAARLAPDHSPLRWSTILRPFPRTVLARSVAVPSSKNWSLGVACKQEGPVPFLCSDPHLVRSASLDLYLGWLICFFRIFFSEFWLLMHLLSIFGS